MSNENLGPKTVNYVEPALNSKPPKRARQRISRKLLTPVIILIATLTIGLISYIVVTNIQRNQLEDTRELTNLKNIVQGNIQGLQNLALGLATEMANNPQVQAAFAKQDRQLLTETTLPTFERVKQDFEVKQYQFILPPATSFLRLHQLDKFGDDLTAFRQTVVQANITQKPVGGIEIGRGGLGVRGEVPVEYQGRYIGIVDVGLDIGPSFLENIKKQYNADAQIMLESKAAQTATFESLTVKGPIDNLLYQAGTLSNPFYANTATYSRVLAGETVVSNLNLNQKNYAIISFPIKDYSGNVIGVFDVISDRTGIVNAQNNNILLTALISLLAMILGGYFIVLFINRTVQPIGALTESATAVANGDLAHKVVIQSNDEFGVLADAFNSMTSQLQGMIGTLEQRVADRTKQLATSGEVSRRLSAITDIHTLTTEIVEQLQSAFNYYHAHIYLLDKATGNLVLAGGTGDVGKSLLERGHQIPQGRGLVGRAAETKEIVLVSNTRKDPNWLPNPLLPDTKSEIAVPIMAGDEVMGVLDIQNAEPESLTQQDAELLQSITSQIAIAMQNIQSAGTLNRRATELQTVAAISTTTATIRDSQEMLETAVRLTQRRFGLYHAHVFTYEEEAKQLRIAACGWKEGDEHEGTHGTTTIPLEQEQSLVARAARTKQAVIVNDVHSDPGWLPNPLLPDTASEMAVPLIVGDQVLGVMDVQSDRINAFSEEDANIQLTLASQVATSLQNARSFAQTQQRAERETLLNAITQKIQSTTTVEAALQIAAREVGHALGMRPTVVALDPSALSVERTDKVSKESTK